jgi:fumarate hydratase subunit beta
MILWKKIEHPLREDVISSLHSGDSVTYNGPLYSARDKAHAAIKKLLDEKSNLPIDLRGQIIYYMGPSPRKPGQIIGSAGPTTSGRMDAFSEIMLSNGILGMVGKGKRDDYTKELLIKYRAVYFGTFGGAGAFLGKKIISCECVAFHELGPEAIYRLEVRDFPMLVVNDIYGNDLYESAVSNKS